ncbi:MAG: hypothetical protein OHK0022_30370 [Roseiflexaceae bacterium]
MSFFDFLIEATGAKISILLKMLLLLSLALLVLGLGLDAFGLLSALQQYRAEIVVGFFGVVVLVICSGLVALWRYWKALELLRHLSLCQQAIIREYLMFNGSIRRWPNNLSELSALLKYGVLKPLPNAGGEDMGDYELVSWARRYLEADHTLAGIPPYPEPWRHLRG